MYKKNKIDFNLLLKNGYHSRIGYANKQNFPSHSIHNNKILKKMFEKARTQYSLNKNDCIVMQNSVYHSGGENKSNITRKFLLLQLINLPTIFDN